MYTYTLVQLQKSRDIIIRNRGHVYIYTFFMIHILYVIIGSRQIFHSMRRTIEFIKKKKTFIGSETVKIFNERA